MTDANTLTTPLDPNVKLEIKTEEDPELEKIPYQELIGSLLYLAICTRPDISYAVSYLSQFNTCFSSIHWTAAKRVLRYLKGTIDLGIT